MAISNEEAVDGQRDAGCGEGTILARRVEAVCGERFAGPAFCRDEKLAESAFYAWRRTNGERDAEAERSVKARHAASRKSQRSVKPVFVPLVGPLVRT
jgi:hypothetical protein